MKSIVRSAHRGLGPRPVGPPRPRARGLRGRPHTKKTLSGRPSSLTSKSLLGLWFCGLARNAMAAAVLEIERA